MTVHFIPVSGSERSACGRHIGWSHQRAEAARVQAVDCGRCQSTATYKAVLVRSEQMIRRADVDGMVRAEVQRILNIVAKRTNDWADDAGHCDTYDEAIEEINMALPEGYSWPSRAKRFRIRLNTFEVMAADEDAAREKVEQDLWHFIDVDE
jgi:hypothetical protein